MSVEASRFDQIYVGGAVLDANEVSLRPGAVAMKDGRVVAVGEPEQIRERVPNARVIELLDHLLIPGLVNAHTHLDLTTLGYTPYSGDFIDWVSQIGRWRFDPNFDSQSAVREGIRQSLAAGVVCVGDIAGDISAMTELIGSELSGVSYLELFGIVDASYTRSKNLLRAMQDQVTGSDRVRIGLQPHAPYSVSPKLYAEAAAIACREGYMLSTHLSETPEEIQFTRSSEGPFREFLQRIDRWDDSVPGMYSDQLRPIPWFAKHQGVVGSVPYVLAHCNYVDDDEIAWLAACPNLSVAYCPRASAYYHHENHRYRDILNTGINVALGTDSIVCHGSLSILDEMRFLFRRDGTETKQLLRMATCNGMQALGFDPIDASFGEGAACTPIALRFDPGNSDDPLVQVLTAAEDPEVRRLSV